MNFLFFLLSRSLLFITPSVLNSTDIYLSGDPDVISIADGSQRKHEYRVPRDSIGAQVKVKLADGSPVNIYMNRHEASFHKVINPPMNEFTEEKVGLISLNDEKFIMVMHNHLLKMVNASDWSIGKTIDVINALDKTVHMH